LGEGDDDAGTTAGRPNLTIPHKPTQ
jgi:hypothetical protein